MIPKNSLPFFKNRLRMFNRIFSLKAECGTNTADDFHMQIRFFKSSNLTFLTLNISRLTLVCLKCVL